MFQKWIPTKILILRLSAVGDVIRTLPAVKALKEHYSFLLHHLDR